jgi:hypothetical protein
MNMDEVMFFVAGVGIGIAICVVIDRRKKP